MIVSKRYTVPVTIVAENLRKRRDMRPALKTIVLKNASSRTTRLNTRAVS